MIVTDLQYHLENKLIKKLDIMISRCESKTQRKDAVLIVEGAEGEGKTNTSEAVGYYVKYNTKRDMHMFFRLQNLLDFAKKTEGKIIIWDEPALDSLSTDWYKEASVNLIRMLMTCRKKRHFFIFNFVKFYKFSEYVVVDRALGLIHMYSRGGIQSGRFAYVRQKNLQYLYTDYKIKKKREYRTYRSFGGSFPIVEKHLGKMGLIIEGIPNCDLEMYEKLKDKAIDSIGTQREQSNAYLIKYKELKKKVSLLELPIKNKDELSRKLGIIKKTLYNWGHSDEENTDKATSIEEVTQ